jgi:hypothetical protein
MRMKHSKERVFDVLIEQDSEGYYVASVPALPGCHTQACEITADKFRELL